LLPAVAGGNKVACLGSKKSHLATSCAMLNMFNFEQLVAQTIGYNSPKQATSCTATSCMSGPGLKYAECSIYKIVDSRGDPVRISGKPLRILKLYRVFQGGDSEDSVIVAYTVLIGQQSVTDRRKPLRQLYAIRGGFRGRAVRAAALPFLGGPGGCADISTSQNARKGQICDLLSTSKD